MTCLSDYVAENLNAMHLARKTFIEQESAERLRRALNRKSRTYVNSVYCQGDKVYYWRNDQNECHGPATVIGKDGKQVLLKHGGSYIRVHPCRMQHCNVEPYNQQEESSPTSIQESHHDVTQDRDIDLGNSHSDDDEAVDTMNNIHNVNENVVDDCDGWVHVRNKNNLPKINSVVECNFPGYEQSIKCRVLSRAGKSSTQNWHFMNIQEDGEDNGKCCSFRDATWRTVVTVDEADE